MKKTEKGNSTLVIIEVVCTWCSKIIGYKYFSNKSGKKTNSGKSHGFCSECMAVILENFRDSKESY